MNVLTLKRLREVSGLAGIILFLSSVFVIDPTLMHGLIASKWLWLALVAIPIGITTAAFLLLHPAKPALNLADLLILVLPGWILTRGFLADPMPNHLIWKLLAIIMLWIFIRVMVTGRKQVEWVILIYLSFVAVQCVYGLLQLYGLMSSNHSQFLITGSFHNPGPFSGFVVSGLPMALGLFLYSRGNRRLAEESLPAIKVGLPAPRAGKQLEENRDHEGLRRGLFMLPLRLPEANTMVYYFSQLIVILLLLVLPAARSRAAWLGAIAGSLFILWSFRENLKINRWFTFRFHSTPAWRKTLVVFAGLLFILMSFTALYKFKQGSADGRLFMWQVSWEMIKDKPLTGWGPGGFEAHFGNYQANWFRDGNGTPAQELVAGLPDSPFNEPIRIGIEYGLIGLSLFLCLVFVLLANPQLTLSRPGYRSRNPELRTRNSQLKWSEAIPKRHRDRPGFNSAATPNPQLATLNSQLTTCLPADAGKAGKPQLLQAALISILIFSLFSYPLDTAPIVVQFIILAALITNLQTPPEQPMAVKKNIRLTLLPKIAMALAILVMIPVLSKAAWNTYKGHQRWKEAYQLYQYQIYDDAIVEYDKAIEYIPHDGLLWQMYGKCLAIEEDWSQARQALEKAATLRSDPILYTALGDTYKALKEYNKAEAAYWQAWYMVPHKFYPKYLLAKLYDESGQKEKATDIALELINKEIKVESMAIEEMKKEIKKILNKGL